MNDRGVFAAANSVAAQPDRDGNVLLKDLFGPTLVRVDGAGNWHLKAVLYGGRDVVRIQY